VCGCTDDDCSKCIAITGTPCSWVEPDLCSACVDYVEIARMVQAATEAYLIEVKRRLDVVFGRRVRRIGCEVMAKKKIVLNSEPSTAPVVLYVREVRHWMKAARSQPKSEYRKLEVSSYALAIGFLDQAKNAVDDAMRHGEKSRSQQPPKT
jgi:hypothetical protein